MADGERRTAGFTNTRFNAEEWKVVCEKAEAAGLTPTEWTRYAALERHPPRRRVIPEINQEAWRELARLAATLNGAMWRFRPGQEVALREAFEAVRRELAAVRNELIGAGGAGAVEAEGEGKQ
jgi:hypothetical protein